MGILINTTYSTKRSKYTKLLIKNNRWICLLLYAAGIIWFCLLAHKDLNNATYFSENALLPGLVYSEIRNDHVAYCLNLYDELQRERETHKSTTPHAWIQAKMRQIGIDTFTHNFTLNYPFGGGRKFTGKNVYGILRAPHVGSTESFVISAPYRPPDTVHSEITHSIPVLLSFANFARKQKYWAKDIIFLITEQEQLGMQAWLHAYQGLQESDVLQSGNLNARAGSIQAAINLELHDFDVDYIDVKIEGLNGQLPNLDLVNLVNKLAMKEGLSSGHRQKSNRRRAGAKSKYEHNLKHLLGMVLTQSTGVPNGNHGLFHRYGIEALTIESHSKDTINHQRKTQGAAAQIKLVEGISRSLNNLLQRFHRSFFFYLLVASDRYISIGDYSPSLGLMAGCLLIKAFVIWLKLNNKDSENEQIQSTNSNFIDVGKYLIAAHAFGFLILYLPFSTTLEQVFIQHAVSTERFLFYLFATLSAVMTVLPSFVKFNLNNIQMLHVAALLETGTALIIVGMINISLGLILSTFIVPFAILINPESNRCRSLKNVLCILFHPFLVIYMIILAVTVHLFPELSFGILLKRAVLASMSAITYSVVDSIIYGNWMFDMIALVFCPVWAMFWNVSLFKLPSHNEPKMKTN